MRNVFRKKTLWGVFFLLIGGISVFSFVFVSEKNYKLLGLGILMILAGISELLFSDNKQKEVNEKYAHKAATITVLVSFSCCVIMSVLLYVMPESHLLSSLSTLNVFEIIAGVIGTCYLGSYFVLKHIGGKKHD